MVSIFISCSFGDSSGTLIYGNEDVDASLNSVIMKDTAVLLTSELGIVLLKLRKQKSPAGRTKQLCLLIWVKSFKHPKQTAKQNQAVQ